MSNVTMKDMLEAGVHYGHQTRRWNPKMRPYIFGERNGIHIIDLQKTVRQFKKAMEVIDQITSRRGHILIVGTKRLARDIVRDEATRAGQYYINYRWLGGTLTNFNTIRQSISRLKRMEKMQQDGTFKQLTKREAIGMGREIEKLELYLGGIKDMPSMPRAIFLIDAHKEQIAVAEANRLGIPVFAVTDTNADPDGIDYLIPGNDDSLKSIQLFCRAAADACIAGKAKSRDFNAEQGDDKEINEGSFRDQSGHKVNVSRKKQGEDAH